MKLSHFCLLVGLFVSVTLNGCATVNSGSVGVKSTFGSVKNEPLQPGLHLALPMVDWVDSLSVQTIAKPEEFTSLTKDSQKIVVHATATYALSDQKAIEAYVKIGRTNEQIESTLVQPVLLSAVKDVISKYAMTFIIENQTVVAEEISKEIVERLKTSGYIVFGTFNVTGFVLDPNVQESVEKKQIAIQELERKQTELKTATLEAKRLESLNVSLTPAVLTKLAIDKWDGHSVTAPGGQAGVNLLIQPEKNK